MTAIERQTEGFQFRAATAADVPTIWDILAQAIERRRLDGSEQWQDGYPNPDVIKKDIADGAGYVLTDGPVIAAYGALKVNDEPAYLHIDGNWLTDGDFLVVHRVAVSDQMAGKGVATRFFKILEDFAKSRSVYSIKVDTNFDNSAMLHILEKLDYYYCGEVMLRGAPRKAFEKRLD